MSEQRQNNSLVPVPGENDPNSDNPTSRQPENMQQLLRLTLDATGNNEQANYNPLSEESRKWLNAALSDMSTNVIEELSKGIKVLEGVSNITDRDSPEEFERALDIITSYVDNMDISNDFHKIGGFTIFDPLLSSPHPCLRSKAANLIAEVTQNNVYCQSRITHLFPKLLEMVRDDPEPEVKVKALYALSCSLRDYPPSLEYIVKHDGFGVLLSAMQSNIEKLQIKAAFLLSALCSESNAVKEHVIERKMIDHLAELLTKKDQPYEHMLAALLSIVRDHPQAQEECKRPELYFYNTLIKLREHSIIYENLDQRQHCQELLTLLYNETFYS
ncbi:hsp70-binding protein 1 [Neocloeon triangulifer]|uniref:hsp70-binding protein 1 n=1 Tax=Neocloeon triangulifer TaxID=2078957 RepID=UPI00286F8836|nr:hsp70-binding protein 1 [Neocloeon triangulifer]